MEAMHTEAVGLKVHVCVCVCVLGGLPVLVCVAGVSHQVIVNVRLKDKSCVVIDVRVELF